MKIKRVDTYKKYCRSASHHNKIAVETTNEAGDNLIIEICEICGFLTVSTKTEFNGNLKGARFYARIESKKLVKATLKYFELRKIETNLLNFD